MCSSGSIAPHSPRNFLAVNLEFVAFVWSIGVIHSNERAGGGYEIVPFLVPAACGLGQQEVLRMTYLELLKELGTFSEEELDQAVTIEDVRGELFDVQYLVRPKSNSKPGNFMRLFEWHIQ